MNLRTNISPSTLAGKKLSKVFVSKPNFTTIYTSAWGNIKKYPLFLTKNNLAEIRESAPKNFYNPAPAFHKHRTTSYTGRTTFCTLTPAFNTLTPTFNMGTPAFYTDTPASYTDTPTFNMGTPASYTDTPAFNMDTPAKNIELKRLIFFELVAKLVILAYNRQFFGYHNRPSTGCRL